jgi:hypothetical protein
MLGIVGACILGILIGVALSVSITLQQNKNAFNTTTTLGPGLPVQGS